MLDACALGLGDGNGVVEPGESVTLIPGLIAAGADFTAISGILDTAASGVTLDDAAATWPDLTAGVPQVSDPPHLRLSVDPFVPCGSVVGMTLRITAAEGGPFDLPLSIPVGELDPQPVVPVAIPDLATAQSTLQVTKDVALATVAVRVRLAHSYVGDLRLQVQSPLGTRVTLLDRPRHPAVNGGCPDDDMDVTFDDAATLDPETHCAATTPWLSGLARPVTSLAALTGQRSGGTWRLLVADMGVGDTGVIQDWELITTPSVAGTCTACANCPGQEIATTLPSILRVSRGAAGSVVLTYPGASSACAAGVQVRSAPTARPATGIGSFPSDPPFADVTAQDTDPGGAFAHVPPAGAQYYLVVENLPGGRPGPSGSYGY